jgi:hypothetical protein
VAAAQQATVSIVLQNLYSRYVACDYQGALVCSSTLGIGLFDATIIGVLGYLLIILLVATICPGMQVLIARLLGMVLIYAILWMGYGASPLCTLSSIFGGIRGLPACLPVDASTLVSEIFPQCPYVPPSLIDPRDFAEANVTLCGTCGTAPRLLDCATAVGFLNGYDVFFYLSALNLPTTFNPTIADLTSFLLPDVATVARLYTPEYAASLGDAGMNCAGILFPDLFISATVLGLRVARVALIAVGVILFLLGVIWAAIAAIFAANFLLLQMEKGFVHGMLVQKLRIRTKNSDLDALLKAQ